MKDVTFRGKRIDNGAWVYGHYFKTPLTAENFEADSFQAGKTRHCISDNNGVAFEIDIETKQVCDIDGATIIGDCKFSNSHEDY